MVNPPVPPNLAYFLERGLRETGRWCVPLILRLDPRVGVDDVRSVLTAVTNHHDVLRLQIVERAGTWEQHIAEPQEFTELSTRSLPENLAPGSTAGACRGLGYPRRTHRRAGVVLPGVGCRVYHWLPR